MARENTPPKRVVAGQKTLLSRTMHDIRFDSVHDEFYVNNPFAYAILTFRGAADGEEAPIRIIQGPKTMLGTGSRLEEDPVHNEIFVPTSSSILVFDRTAQGDVAPKRVLKGPDTMIRGGGGVVVDPVHDLLIVGVSGNKSRPGALLIFDRTADGNVKPKRVVTGPHTGIIRALQLQVYPPTGWIAVAQPSESGPVAPEDTFIGFWKITDDGDVAPRWKLAGPKSTLIKPRGVALMPAHKEIVVSDMSLNALVTFYFPEIF